MFIGASRFAFAGSPVGEAGADTEQIGDIIEDCDFLKLGIWDTNHDSAHFRRHQP